MSNIERVRPAAEDNPGGLDQFRTERVTKEVDLPISPGWASSRRPARRESVKFDYFKVPDDGEEILVKFLDDMPFAPLIQHWVMTDKGRRSYTCLEDDTCPMCARGDKPKSSDWLNIVQLGDTPSVKVWAASSDPATAIEEFSKGKRTSPINRPKLYAAVSKKKAATGFFTYSLARVEEDELKDDWGVNPLTAEQLTEFNSRKYDGSVIRIHTLAELSEAARLYLDND